MDDERLKELAEEVVTDAHGSACTCDRDRVLAALRRVRDEQREETSREFILLVDDEEKRWSERSFSDEGGRTACGAIRNMGRRHFQLTDEPGPGHGVASEGGPASSGENGAPELEHESWCHAVMNECNCGAESAAEEEG